MPPAAPKKVRGVFEHPKGSKVWWIQYFDHGRRRRERVGTKGNAINLYQKRRTEILVGDKLPELRRKRVTVGELIDDAIAFAKEHNRSFKDTVCKGELMRPAFGSRTAEDVKPEELAAWIRKRDVGPATFNRYRAFLSLCFREGIRNGKVKVNPARMLRLKRELGGRRNFLTREEYARVLAAMHQTHPDRVAAFLISVQSGMRLSEQFRLKWKFVNMERKLIDLRWTKNGDDRMVPMTSEVLSEFERIRPARAQPGDLVFPRPRGGKLSPQPRWFKALLGSEDVGVADYTWHNNRHTFCSWLAMAGVSLKTIQVLAGHRTISVTAKYAHLSPDHTSTEIEKLVRPTSSKVLEFPGAIRTAIG